MGDIKVTAIVIAYKRPWTVDRWVSGLRRQTVPVEIWVWDNAGDFPDRPDIDVIVRSSRNFLCQPRFLIAGAVKSPYVFNQDDDVAIKDECLFEKLIAESEKYPDAFFGWNGRSFANQDKINWDLAYQYPGTGWVGKVDTDQVDMLNVGISFYPTHLINQIQLNPYQNKTRQVTEREYKWGDDMWISTWLKNRRVTSFMENGIELLDERDQGLSKQTDHMVVRNELCRRYWKKQSPPEDGADVVIHPEREVLP